MANQEMETRARASRATRSTTSRATAATTASTAGRSSPTPCAGSGRTGRADASEGATRRRAPPRHRDPRSRRGLGARRRRATSSPRARPSTPGRGLLQRHPRTSKIYKIGLDGKVAVFRRRHRRRQRPDVRPRRPALRRARRPASDRGLGRRTARRRSSPTAFANDLVVHANGSSSHRTGTTSGSGSSTARAEARRRRGDRLSQRHRAVARPVAPLRGRHARDWVRPSQIQPDGSLRKQQFYHLARPRRAAATRRRTA